MSRLGIRDRVTIAAALTLAVALGVLTIAVTVLLADRLDRDSDSVLRANSAAVLTTLFVRNGHIQVREPPNDRLLDENTWVFDTHGLVERASADHATQLAARTLGRDEHSALLTVGDTKLLSVPVLDQTGRRAGTAVVGLSLVAYHDTLHLALAGMVLLDLFVLVIGSLVARRAVAVALRPVADMTAKAAEWSDHDLDQRFGPVTPRDELTGLSATLDGLLARIGASIRREQRFSAEVAHELNTPLSGLRAEAELALRSDATPTQTRAALEQVLRSTDRMAAVISTLLSAARTDAEHSPGSSEATDGLHTAIAAVAARAAARNIEISIDVPNRPTLVGAERDMIAQTLNPLLDNAIAHARRQVNVSLARHDGQAVFAVIDDGPGVGLDARDHVFEPGVSTRGSAGLGLPLARRLARACAGDVVLCDVPGRTCFELRLPAID